MRVSASCDKRSKSTRRAYVVEIHDVKEQKKYGEYPEHRIYIVKIKKKEITLNLSHPIGPIFCITCSQCHIDIYIYSMTYTNACLLYIYITYKSKYFSILITHIFGDID